MTGNSNGSEFTVDDLPDDVELDKSLETGVSEATRLSQTYSEQIRKEHENQEKQNTFWRRWVFWTTLPLVVICVATSVGLAIIYFFTEDHPDPTVLSVWFAGNVVQVVGILLVVTKHLFPERAKTAA